MQSLFNQVRFGDVCEIAKGKKPRSISGTDNNGYVPYVLIESFESRSSKFTNDPSVPKCRRGDVLMVMDGASSGLVAIGLEGAIGSTLAAIRPKNGNLVPKYLYYWLKTKYDILNTRTSGSAIPHVDRKILQDLKILIPPVKIQRRISSVLERAEKLQKKREQANQLTHKIIQSVFLKMFGDPTVKGTRWEAVKFGSLCKLTSGKSRPDSVKSRPDSEFIYPVFGGNGIIGFSKQYLVEKPTIILGRVGEYCGNIHLSATTSWISDNALYCKEFLRKDLNLDYLVCCLTLIDLNKLQKRSGQPLITQAIVNNLEIPLPPLNLQQKFGERISRIKEIVTHQEESTQKINELYHSLMQRAFTGQLLQ